MLAAFFSTFAALFSVVNPMGAAPVFLAMTRDETPKSIAAIVLKSCFFFALILIVSYLFGTYIINFFGVSIDAMRMAGGIIIFTSGYALLKGNLSRSRSIDRKVQEEALVKEDISITPLAMPMLSGPGSISFLIGLKSAQGADLTDHLIVISAIAFTAIITYFTLRISPWLVRFLGEAGFTSVSRIMGFIVMSIGVQYLITGVTNVYVDLNHAVR
jgi:multiple antibiotic resistance protein